MAPRTSAIKPSATKHSASKASATKHSATKASASKPAATKAAATKKKPAEKTQDQRDQLEAKFPRAQHFDFFYSCMPTASNSVNGYMAQTKQIKFEVPGEGENGQSMAFVSGEHYYRKKKAEIHVRYNSTKVLGRAFESVELKDLVSTMMEQKTVKDLRCLDRSFKMTAAGLDAWEKAIMKTLYKANFYKFAQSADNRSKLLATGTNYLVEACYEKEGKKTTAIEDRCWCDCGIGYDWMVALGEEDTWQRNLLGKTLMKVRHVFRTNPNKQTITEDELAEADNIERDFPDGRVNPCTCC